MAAREHAMPPCLGPLPAQYGAHVWPFSPMKRCRQFLLVSKLIFVVGVALALADCATERKRKPPSEPKWYQSDMDNEDRDFYLGSFFDTH